MWGKMLRISSSSFFKPQITMWIGRNGESFISMKSIKFLANWTILRLREMCPVRGCSKHCSRLWRERSRRSHLREGVNILSKNSFKLIRQIFCLFVGVPLRGLRKLSPPVPKGRALDLKQRSAVQKNGKLLKFFQRSNQKIY